MKYYICDVRRPNEPFLFTAEHDGKFIPAIYEDKSEAEEICHEMNLTTDRTRYEVKEMRRRGTNHA